MADGAWLMLEAKKEKEKRQVPKCRMIEDVKKGGW